MTTYLAEQHESPDFDDLVQQAIAGAEGPLALYTTLSDAAVGYVMRRECQTAMVYADQAAALLPQLADLDLPEPANEITICIPLDGGEPDISIPPKDPYHALVWEMENFRSTIAKAEAFYQQIDDEN